MTQWQRPSELEERVLADVISTGLALIATEPEEDNDMEMELLCDLGLPVFLRVSVLASELSWLPGWADCLIQVLRRLLFARAARDSTD